LTPKQFDAMSDETEEALWRWELNSPHLHFSEAKVLKKVNHERNELALASTQIKLLKKLID